MEEYLCHQCNRIVEVGFVNSVPQCAICNGEFVEEIPSWEPRAFAHNSPPRSFRGLGPVRPPLVYMPNPSQRSYPIRETRAQISVRSGDETVTVARTIRGHNVDDDRIESIILQMMGQMRVTRPEHIGRRDLSRLPMTKVTKKQVDDETQCATCLETFALDETVASLDCKHIFHRSCIEPWLREHNTCPVCRCVLDPKKWSYSVVDLLD